MLTPALFSALHVFAFALGLAGVVLRGRAMRATLKDAAALPSLFRADNLWGAAAMLWLASGLPRLWLEKGVAFYLNNHLFLVKMALFAVVFALEVTPMVTFLRWRIRRARGEALDVSVLRRLVVINNVETAIVVALPFIAALMARGIGFTLS